MITAEPRTKLLYPLDEFYDRAGLVIHPITEVPGEEVPEPYRRLLVHSRDMTPTLEAYHRERIHLQVIGKRIDADVLSRLVVLVTDDTQRPVEFGAIAIHTDQFPKAAREVVLQCRCPLGTILADYEIQHASAPVGYFKMTPDPLVRGSLGLAGTPTLWGRRNVLRDQDGRVLADVVEILPPAGDED